MTTRALYANLLPVVVAYAIMFGLITAGNATGTQWLLLNGAELIGASIGLWLAWRLRGQIARYLLSGAAVYSAVMFIVHVGIDARAAQGGPTQIAVMGAAFIGVAAGLTFSRQPAARAA
jgi:hypothetical protein